MFRRKPYCIFALFMFILIFNEIFARIRCKIRYKYLIIKKIRGKNKDKNWQFYDW